MGHDPKRYDFERVFAAADPTRTSAYVGIAALNSLDALGPKAAPLIDSIRTMPTRDPRAAGRANGYVSRLQADFLERFNAGKAKGAREAGKAKKKGKG
jgi:hypothetical protein